VGRKCQRPDGIKAPRKVEQLVSFDKGKAIVRKVGNGGREKKKQEVSSTFGLVKGILDEGENVCQYPLRWASEGAGEQPEETLEDCLIRYMRQRYSYNDPEKNAKCG